MLAEISSFLDDVLHEELARGMPDLPLSACSGVSP
jgi:hypothetical protein